MFQDKSTIVCCTSSSFSPSPNMIEDFVTTSGRYSLQNWQPISN